MWAYNIEVSGIAGNKGSNAFGLEDIVTVISGDWSVTMGRQSSPPKLATNAFRSSNKVTNLKGKVTTASTKAWQEELDFKIAMRRRGRPAGASLDEMAKKYGL
jgi:hypothetical protein